MFAVAVKVGERLLELIQQGVEFAVEQTFLRTQLAAQTLVDDATMAIDRVLPGTSPEMAGLPALSLIYMLVGGAVVVWKLRSLRS